MNILKSISEKMEIPLSEIPKETVIRAISIVILEPSMPPMDFLSLNQRITDIFHAHFLDKLSFFNSAPIGIVVIYSYEKTKTHISEPEKDEDLTLYNFHLPITPISKSENPALEYLKWLFDGLVEIFIRDYGISETEVHQIYQQLEKEVLENPALQPTLLEF